ncbi:Unannotated [Lentimonas sp. CC19]|nr:Unannotated [Lentimonas sp. CC19]CAA6692217.1 Unannotated [Lentimonas sp. CC10]CAA7070159.1 Unannotated [Lentimonas sp. CC11]
MNHVYALLRNDMNSIVNTTDVLPLLVFCSMSLRGIELLSIGGVKRFLAERSSLINGPNEFPFRYETSPGIRSSSYRFGHSQQVAVIKAFQRRVNTSQPVHTFPVSYAVNSSCHTRATTHRHAQRR